jgi:hypothetical protein
MLIMFVITFIPIPPGPYRATGTVPITPLRSLVVVPEEAMLTMETVAEAALTPR